LKKRKKKKKKKLKEELKRRIFSFCMATTKMEAHAHTKKTERSFYKSLYVRACMHAWLTKERLAKKKKKKQEKNVDETCIGGELHVFFCRAPSFQR
jgi:hypothetical protein